MALPEDLGATLLLWRTHDASPPADLVLGEQPGDAAQLGDATAAVQVALGRLAPAIALRFDNRVQRGVRLEAASAWQVGAPSKGPHDLPFRQAARTHARHRSAWRRARPRRSQVWLPAASLERTAPAASMRWDDAVALPSPALTLRAQFSARTARPGTTLPWREATPVALRDWPLRWVVLRRTARPVSAAPWRRAIGRSGGARAPFGVALPVPVLTAVPWREGRGVPPGVQAPAVPPAPAPCYRPDLPAVLVLEAQHDAALPAVLLFLCDRAGPTPEPLVVVPIRSVYIVINQSILRRVDTDVLIPALSMSLSLDVDSWAWGFSASVPATALVDLEPAALGEPVELEAVINGQAFRVLAEKLSRERAFGSSTLRVQGRGKTALLDQPYAPVLSRDNGTGLRTARQLMDDALTLNGVSIGWTVDWQIVDWPVPAGAWTHQGSYIAALTRIAEAAGAYIQPHRTDLAVRVLHRYPAPPWEWGALAPQYELPAAVTVREGIDWADKALYNRVFVSGEGEGGVLGRVTRAGSAGDAVAPMIVDPLVTHADAARQRGRVPLSDVGRQASVSLRLPVLPLTGIIDPGALVRYVDGGVQRMGLVRSVQVDVEMPTVFQTLSVETHEP